MRIIGQVVKMKHRLDLKTPKYKTSLRPVHNPETSMDQSITLGTRCKIPREASFFDYLRKLTLRRDFFKLKRKKTTTKELSVKKIPEP